MKTLGRYGAELSLVIGVSVLGVLLAACGRSTGGTSSGSQDAAAHAGAAHAAVAGAAGGPVVKAAPKEGAGSMGTAGSKRNEAENQVVIENFAFSPATLTVKAGAEVTWVNRDQEPHTATDNDKRFDSGVMDTDGKFSFTFKTPGTYSYFCALHPKMTGQIVVK